MPLVTIFEDVWGRDLVAEDMTLEELFERIRNTSAPSKGELPLLKLARFGSKRTPPIRATRGVVTACATTRTSKG